MSEVLERALKEFESEIKKDKLEIQRDKNKFLKDVVNGLGAAAANFENYKKSPSRWKKFKLRLKKVLWNV